MRICLFFVLSFMILVVTEKAFSAGELKAVSVERDQSRVILLLEKKTVHQVQTMNDPPRVVVDLPDTLLPTAAKSLETDASEVAKVRYAQYTMDPPVVRVVLEVKNTENWRVRGEKTPKGYQIVVYRAPLEEKLTMPSSAKIQPASSLQKDSKGFIALKVLSGPVKGLRIGKGQVRLLLRNKFILKPQLSQDQEELLFWVPGKIDLLLPAMAELKDPFFREIRLEESESPQGERAVKVRLKLQWSSSYRVEADSTEEEIWLLVLPKTQITNLSVASFENHPQIQIESLVPLTYYRLFKLTEPDRLIIDIPQAVYAAPSHLEGLEGTLLQGLRGAQFSSQISRVVIDLKEKTKYEDSLSPDGKKILITLKGINIQENPRVVVIDPGHGGVDPGAEGLEGTQEKEITLAVALKLKKLLEEKKYVVLMTRHDDMSLTLPPRIDLANQNNADLFISIHCNAFPRSSKMKGIETYYYNKESLDFARIMHSHLILKTRREDRGLKKNTFVVIKYTAMPSLLIEMDFLSNPDAEKYLTNPENQRLYAEAILDGIEAYFASINIAKASQ